MRLPVYCVAPQDLVSPLLKLWLCALRLTRVSPYECQEPSVAGDAEIGQVFFAGADLEKGAASLSAALRGRRVEFELMSTDKGPRAARRSVKLID